MRDHGQIKAGSKPRRGCNWGPIHWDVEGGRGTCNVCSTNLTRPGKNQMLRRTRSIIAEEWKIPGRGKPGVDHGQAPWRRRARVGAHAHIPRLLALRLLLSSSPSPLRLSLSLTLHRCRRPRSLSNHVSSPAHALLSSLLRCALHSKERLSAACTRRIPGALARCSSAECAVTSARESGLVWRACFLYFRLGVGNRAQLRCLRIWEICPRLGATS